jgi:hypothetical protein
VKLVLIYTLLIIAAGCTAGGGYEKATDPQDAGREFIRASLDGDHQKARFYLLQDTTNLLMIERQQRDYEQLDHEEKKLHRESTIRPVSINKINDTSTVYTYYNTYNPKDTTSITIVKSDGAWLVDLKSILKQ